MKQDINRYEILEKITPLIENTAVRFNLIPIEIEFIKENHKWFLRIYLYSYEKDILYALAIPMYYGKGSRYYLNIKYDLTNSISLWCKFAQTVYADGRESISSGKEEIKGNRKSDVRFMLRWEF